MHGWGTVALVGLLMAVAAGGTVVGGTFAATSSPLSAKTSYDTTSVSSAKLTPPTAATVTASGNSTKLKWTKGATTPKTGKHQVLKVVDLGRKTATCSAVASFGPLTSSLPTTPALSATATTYTDLTRAKHATVQAGDWICYRIETTYGTSWTSIGAYPEAQAGLVATTLSFSGGKTGKVTNTTSVVVHFNQKVSAPTTGTVCTTTTKTYAVILGDTTATSSATCATSNSYVFGRLVSTVPLNRALYYPTGTYTLGTGTKKLTLKFKGATGTKPTFTGTPTWTFIPYATLEYKTTAGIKICTANTNSNTLCRPHVTTKKF